MGNPAKRCFRLRTFQHSSSRLSQDGTFSSSHSCPSYCPALALPAIARRTPTSQHLIFEATTTHASTDGMPGWSAVRHPTPSDTRSAGLWGTTTVAASARSGLRCRRRVWAWRCPVAFGWCTPNMACLLSRCSTYTSRGAWSSTANGVRGKSLRYTPRGFAPVGLVQWRLI